MKVLKFSSIAFTALLMFGIYACQKDMKSPDVTSAAKPVASNDCSGYTITLINKNDLSARYPGTAFDYEGNNIPSVTTTFVWTVTNAKGTQALSHWAFEWKECVDPEDILYVAAIYGTNEEVYESAPKVDPSQICNTKPVVKFDMGNNNGATKYIVIMAGNYTWSAGQDGYVKSGAKTGCCTFQFDGIDCSTEKTCSLSQGFYFAKPGPTWPAPGTVIIGGITYLESEGRAIWNTSNQKGKADAKAAFLQLAAIKLSGVDISGTEVGNAASIIESYFTGKPKLTPTNVNDESVFPSDKDVKEASGFIGDWIQENHCEN